MNSRVTMALAGLLLMAAVFFGYWGLVLSRQPEPAPVQAQPVAPNVVESTVSSTEDQTRQPVVVLVHDVPLSSPGRHGSGAGKTAHRAARQPECHQPGGGTHPMAAIECRDLAQ